jgi:hypothetical protein
MKILDVSWCNDYGFVTIDNGYEVKTYMGKAEYMLEEQNINNILNFGTKVLPQQLERILSFYKEKKDE